MGFVVAAMNAQGKPEIAFPLLEYFSGYSTDEAEQKIFGYVRAKGGDVHKLIGNSLKEAREKNWKGRQAYWLAEWAKSDPEGSREEVLEFTNSIDMSALKNWDFGDLAKAFKTLLPLIGKADRNAEIIEASGDEKPWVALLSQIEPAHPNFKATWENAMASSKSDREQLLEVVKPYEDFYNQTFDLMLAEAGRDRLEIEKLLRSVAKTGDFEKANSVRMKVSKNSRESCDTVLGREAIRHGNISAGIFLLGALKSNFGTHGFEFEVMEALVHDCWDGVNYIS